MEGFRGLVALINNVLWDYILVFALIAIGVFMTVKLGFPQFTRLLPELKKILVNTVKKKEASLGKVTPFQALSTAVAAQVGTGNIVGVATAIAAGGPGAAFWMIVSAFFGMATIFSEAALAQKYREKKDGELVGGPAYYIKNGLKSKRLAFVFSAIGIFSLGVVGIMIQSNSIAGSVSTAFNIPVVVVTIALTIVVSLILMGGLGRIVSFAEAVVPIMAAAYILGSLLVILMNLENLLPAIKSIFIGAFRPQAIGGGVLGITIQQSLRFGMARGLFSNEAGLGSTAHSHAVADARHPAEQGFIAMLGVFISTFLICLSTVMVNMVSGAYDGTISAAEMTESAIIMTQNGFMSSFGSLGAIFLSLCITFFSLTTIVSWFFFAETNVIYLLGSNPLVTNIFKAIVITSLVAGSLMDPSFVWQLNDMSTGLMAIPNIIALSLLSKEVKKILDDYDSKLAIDDLYWDYKYEEEEFKSPSRDSKRRQPKTYNI